MPEFSCDYEEYAHWHCSACGRMLEAGQRVDAAGFKVLLGIQRLWAMVDERALCGVCRIKQCAADLERSLSDEAKVPTLAEHEKRLMELGREAIKAAGSRVHLADRLAALEAKEPPDGED